MNTYLILRRRGWTDPIELEKAAGRSSRVSLEELSGRVVWVRSYVTREADGWLGTACIFQAVDAEALSEHARRAGMPCDEIIPIAQTVVINDDPVPAAQ